MKAVIVGGTGTLGREMAKRLLAVKNNQITIVSRDELKQKEMEAEFKDPRLQFRLGDIRERLSLDHLFFGSDVVFHFAALKHIDSMESNPEECVKTNILGTIHVADACIAQGVKYCVFSSTDKAVDPINAYGMSKGISEKILLNRNRAQNRTHFKVYRWGNVVGSRGSAIHSFAKTLKEKGEVHLTDPKMTRFWIKIEDAVTFILNTYQDRSIQKPLIPEIKAARTQDIINTIARKVCPFGYQTRIIGLRPGEKLHESLSSLHSDFPIDSDRCDEYTSEELEQMIWPLIDHYGINTPQIVLAQTGLKKWVDHP